MFRSDTPTDSSSNSGSFQNMENLCKQLSDDESGEQAKTNPDLALDLRSILPNFGPASEQDSEKLSAVLEQPEDTSTILEGPRSLRHDQEDRDLKYLTE